MMRHHQECLSIIGNPIMKLKLVIAICALDLAARGFRPDWNDLGRASLVSAVYVAIIMPVNHSQSCQRAKALDRSGLPVMRGHIS